MITRPEKMSRGRIKVCTARLGIVLLLLLTHTPNAAANVRLQNDAQTQNPPGSAPTPSPSPSIDDQIKEMEERIKLLAKQAELAAAEKKLRDAEAANREDLAEIQERTEVINKKKDEVEAQKNLLKSIFPTASAKSMEGKITGGETLILENQIITYNSLDKISWSISKEIQKAVSDRNRALSGVIIYNTGDINSIVQYVTLMNQLTQAVKNYQSLLNPPVVIPGSGESGSTAAASALMAPQLASSVLSSVIDLISLFRTDTEFKAANITVDSNALISQVAGALLQRNPGVKVYYPEVLPANILFMKDDETLDIITALNNLIQQKNLAAQKIAEFDAQSDDNKKLNPLRNNVSKLKALNEQVDKINADLLKADQNTQATPLSMLIKAERLRKIGKEQGTYILFIKSVQAAGTNKVTKNLFMGTKMYHSGGAIVSFVLFDNDGAAICSKTVYNYDGFIKVRGQDGTLQSNINQ